MNTIENLKGIVFGHPLTEQAKAELEEARIQVEQAIKALEAGLAPTEGNIGIRDILVTAKGQLANAGSGLRISTSSGRQDDPYYQTQAELGVHRVREAITNLKDVLRMLKVPE